MEPLNKLPFPEPTEVGHEPHTDTQSYAEKGRCRCTWYGGEQDMRRSWCRECREARKALADTGLEAMKAAVVDTERLLKLEKAVENYIYAVETLDTTSSLKIRAIGDAYTKLRETFNVNSVS